MARRQHGEGALYKRADGMWVGTVEVGFTPDGKRKRKTVSSKSFATAQRKLTALKRTVETHGDAPDARVTVGDWLTYWVENIAISRIRPRTLESYRTIVNRHLIPHLGKRRLDQLAPQHVREMYRTLGKPTDDRKALAGSYVLKMHWTLSEALEDALREGKVTRNVTALLDAPQTSKSAGKWLTVDQAKTLLTSAGKIGDPMAGRWAAALLLGARQGELLGLEWERVDLEHGTADLAWQLQRLKFRHGCDGTCGLTRAGSCPKREPDIENGFEARPVEGGLYLTKPKSRKGERLIPLPTPMTAILRLTQRPTGLVWTRDDGRPIDPRDDAKAWHAALKAADLPDVNLHGARHTTATWLLELGVDPQVIKKILGHSSAVTTRGYQHVSQPLERAAMDSLGGLLALDPA